MDFYTVVLRESGGYRVALCLENGLVGQGNTKERAIEKLKEAIDSFDDVYKEEKRRLYRTAINKRTSRIFERGGKRTCLVIL